MDPKPFSKDSQNLRTDGKAVLIHGDNPVPPTIPDHHLLRCIGHGSYGVVWLAQNTMGTFRAVKIVYRQSFKDERPFERELAGIRKFEPISRSHEGFVHILHVGINAEQGYFYYVMELGDDQLLAQSVDPKSYAPRTLGKDVAIKGSLPVKECLQLGLALSLALAELHKRGLVHRDVKPSNIIFVNGVPKLADIGLVAEINEAQSYVGTEGFIPPEGPGSAQADVYSLGKVLYEASTGKDRQDFPELPTQLDKIVDPTGLLELNEVILTACKNDIAKRYQTAWEMHADLVVLANGKSVRRLNILEQRLTRLKRIALISSAVVLILGLCFFQFYHDWKINLEMRQRQVGENMAYGDRAVESGDLLGALPYFAEVLRLDQGNPKEEEAHRLLFGSTLAQCPKLNQMWFMAGDVRDGEFNSDGTEILIPEFDGKTKIYNLPSGAVNPRATLEGSWVDGSSWSPDGKFGVTASEHNAAYLWDAASLKIIHTFSHPDSVSSARFNPDGSILVTTCWDGLVRLWNTQTGQLERTLKGHTKAVRFAEFSHNGRLLATAGLDNTVMLWDVATGLPLRTPLPHGSWVNGVAFSPDDKTLVTASSDRKARLWDVATGRRLLVDLNHQDGVESVQFSPDGRMIVTASLDGTARVWLLENLQSIASYLILRHSAGVMHATFSPDGHHILTICTDGSVRLWDLAGASASRNSASGVVSQDGNWILATTNRELTITKTGQKERVIKSFTAPFPVKMASLNRDGCFLLCISDDETNADSVSHLIQAWDVNVGKIILPPLLFSNSFTGATLSDDGKFLVIFGGKAAWVWDVARQSYIGSPIVLDDLVESAFFSPDGKSLAVHSKSILQVRNTSSGQPVFPALEFATALAYVTFSPNSRLLATCCSDDQIHKCCAKLWDARTGRPGMEFWHNDGVLSAAFSPDCKRLVTASEDYTAKIWDIETGKQLTPDLKHGDKVCTAEFSPDGEWIVTSSVDKTARVWNATTGDSLTPPLHQMFPMAKAQFLAGRFQVITTDNRSNSWIWNLFRDQRPTEDTRKTAQLLSGRTLASGVDSSSQPQNLLRNQWRDLSSKYPSTFITSSQETLAWEKLETEENENEQQWAAACFHLQQLLSKNPSDQSVHSRLTNAEEYLNRNSEQ